MIMDSGFCVLQAVIKLVSVDMYLSVVIKKRRYRPKYIDDGDIDLHFEIKEVGNTNSLTGTLDGTKLKYFV
jgi:hypothetical protein